jgi:hypothetical protein
MASLTIETMLRGSHLRMDGALQAWIEDHTHQLLRVLVERALKEHRRRHGDQRPVVLTASTLARAAARTLPPALFVHAHAEGVKSMRAIQHLL